jgi:hypothetical protein
MSPEINGSQIFKIACTFYLGFAGESVKRRFLISNVTSGNRTLCRGQCVDPEVRVEGACSR